MIEPNEDQTGYQRPMTAEGELIYRIPEANQDALQARVVKMNRRAAKLGMEPIVVTVIGEEFETRTKRIPLDDFGRTKTVEYQVRFILVTVAGKCPRVNGWTFAATIQHEEGGNILRTVPGFETCLPIRFRTAETACEHCGTNRRRTDTYVLQFSAFGAGMKESWDWKQVGRNCLADFLRTDNAGALAEYAEMLASLDSEMGEYEDEGFGGGGGGKVYYTALALLTQVACCVRVDGWCSRGEARASYVPKTATVDHALMCFDPKLWAKLSAADQEKLTPTEADGVRAAAAIAWAQELPADVANDYLWNIRVVSHREQIGSREAGLAGSIISAYNRFLEQEMERKYERDNPSNWFGTVGKREVFTLTVIGRRDIESDYGSSTLYMFRTATGDRGKWFSSNSAELVVGEVYTVKATVKEHEQYKGSNQTMLSRLVIYDAAAEAQAKADAKATKKAAKLAAKESGAVQPSPDTEVPCAA